MGVVSGESAAREMHVVVPRQHVHATHDNHRLRNAGVVAVLVTACATSQKPFDQMTAQEHRVAADRENQLADKHFAKVTGENIEPPETMPTGDVYDYAYE